MQIGRQASTGSHNKCKIIYRRYEKTPNLLGRNTQRVWENLFLHAKLEAQRGELRDSKKGERKLCRWKTRRGEKSRHRRQRGVCVCLDRRDHSVEANNSPPNKL